MMSDIEKTVQLIYDFESEDSLEIEAFKQLVGINVYNATMVFKTVKAPIDKAIEFWNKMLDMNSALDLF